MHMMKMIFNMMTHHRTSMLRLVIIAPIAGVFLVPDFALAATATSTRPDTSVRGVCLRVVSLENAFRSKLTDAGKAYAKAADIRAGKLRGQANQRGIEDIEARTIADAKLKAYIKTLRTQAQGDATKEAAIDVFARAVTDATVERRAATDAAQKQFALGVRTLADARVKEVAAQAAAFQTDISGAFASTKSACDSGVDPKDVRNQLHATLGAIDLKYKAQFADQRSINDGLQALAATRAEALTAAAKAFRASLDSASQALHSVLQ